MSWTDGPNGLEKDRPMARLQEELARVKAPLRYPERTAKEASFGCSPPSSKGRVKSDALPERPPRRGGAQKGHPGHGRKAVGLEEADRVERVPLSERCPDGQTVMTWIGTRPSSRSKTSSANTPTASTTGPKPPRSRPRTTSPNASFAPGSRLERSAPAFA